MVVVIIGVGGATRLTGSGLSITEWSPITGAIPPLTDADWRAAFAKYQTIPQYEIMNKGMSLDAFKTIFWWEWAHRQLGRVIGLAYVLPLLAFLAARQVPRRIVVPLLLIGPLIGLQGAVGWFMVKSGFTANQIAVSPYRLTLHLSLAFAVLGLLVWQGLQLRRASTGGATASVPMGVHVVMSVALVALVYLQVVLGGFVAGLRAGLTYNTWPLMDGAFIPSGLGALEPWYRNLAENVTTVQFDHRVSAYALTLLAIAHAVIAWRSKSFPNPGRATAFWLAGGIVAQAGLGIATLVSVSDGRIPIVLGVAHQVSAALLFVLAIIHVSRILTGAAAASVERLAPASTR